MAKATATVAISNTTQTSDGNPKPVTVTTTPSGLGVDVIYDGSTTAPSAVGSYAVVAAVNNPNYTGSSSATLQIVAPPNTDLVISITDNRDYAQYGHALSYVIVVSNVGNQDVTGATVSDALPVTLLPQQPVSWHCYPAVNSSCASPSGSGDLNTNVGIQAGGSVTIVFDTMVNGAPNEPTDELLNTVTVAASGDSNSSNNNATDTTVAVIFRDGFELNGDGAQVPQVVGTMHPASAGTADEGSLIIPLSTPAPDRVVTTLASGSDAHGEAFRVEALRIDGALRVRMVTRGEQAEQASNWMAVNPGTTTLGLGMVTAESGTTHALLVGASSPIEMALPSAVLSAHIVEAPPAKG